MSFAWVENWCCCVALVQRYKVNATCRWLKWTVLDASLVYFFLPLFFCVCMFFFSSFLYFFLLWHKICTDHSHHEKMQHVSHQHERAPTAIIIRESRTNTFLWLEQLFNKYFSRKNISFHRRLSRQVLQQHEKSATFAESFFFVRISLFSYSFIGRYKKVLSRREMYEHFGCGCYYSVFFSPPFARFIGSAAL